MSLNRVGVSSVKRIVRLSLGGREAPFNGEFSMVADLGPDRAGVHMSRFSELLEEALLDVLGGDERSGTIEELVERVAREIVTSQKALRADVRLRADFGLERWTPVSGSGARKPTRSSGSRTPIKTVRAARSASKQKA